MKKIDEMMLQGSCFNKATMQETIFVLLGRDKAAPIAIRAWVRERIALGLNTTNDAQIKEAIACAAQMELGHDPL